ncbi:MAG TPA: non-homologous end-joining DNA ligase [Chthoniobacterales bacterium]|nr:non-homologous end-joining DNA ligase [Chthoniobacterales bacterium]
MGLTEYKRKRNFSVTAEPSGAKKPRPKKVAGASRFVIQKHNASRLHYDFRLEMDGVLKSWAVPKGIPWQRGEKHLAVEVEDHPIEYEDFEGVIPEGSYGGGTVMVWDRGNYYVHGEKPLEALKEGRLHLVLEGKKLRGDWALIRTRSDGSKNQWLLLKSDADVKPISKKRDDQSAKTGRTMKQIAKDRDAEWESHRQNNGDTPKGLRARVREAVAQKEKRRKKKVPPAAKVGNSGLALPDSLPAAKPRFIAPMKPKLVDTPPAKGGWIYELKFDGFRTVTVKSGGKVKLISRNENDLTKSFQEIASALAQLPCEECVIDGEVVALDKEGRSSFQLLQAREMEGHDARLSYYVFDLLQLDGKNLSGLPLTIRKEILHQLCAEMSEPIRYSGELGDDPEALLAEVRRHGLEGIIGKRADSVYESGRRSGAWIKLKCVNEQEFVIGGYTPPAGARKHFGALLVGYFEKKKLLFAGKVGTGFNTKMLALLHKKFQDERRPDCPFADLPSKQGGKWTQGITPGMMRQITWVNPVFVCQVKFAEWTRDAKLRAPVFLGLRKDKAPGEVKRETPA